MVYFRTPKRKPIQETEALECGVMSLMEQTTDATGRLGEALASAYLQTQNFRIMESNVRFGRYEIDIVAYDPRENMIVFVEVKTRSKFDNRYPIRTAVDSRKRRAMQAAIARWVLKHTYEGPARIDVICVAEGKVQNHIVNIGAEFF